MDYSDEIGRGGFGTVYKGYNQLEETIALKKISNRGRTKASKESVLFHTLKILPRHDNIIEVYDVKVDKDSMWIMMEFCDLGDLNQFFTEHHTYCQHFTVKLQLMKEIIAGIAFLHSNGIVHRDIKPENILLKFMPPGQQVIKLGDFGLSKILDPDSLTSAMSSNVGTLLFKAPEFWNYKPGGKVRYHRNVDVYSAGLTFTAMLQAQPDRDLVPKAEGSLTDSEASLPIGLAVNTRRASNQAEFKVVENQPGDDESTKYLKDVIRGMMCLRPENRLLPSTVHQHLEEILSVSCEDFFVNSVILIFFVLRLYLFYSKIPICYILFHLFS